MKKLNRKKKLLSTRMPIISKKSQICTSSRFYHKWNLMNQRMTPNASVLFVSVVIIHQALITLQAPWSLCEYWCSLRNSIPATVRVEPCRDMFNASVASSIGSAIRSSSSVFDYLKLCCKELIAVVVPKLSRSS